MLRNLLNLVVFVVGLVAVCWIGAGYLSTNPLGLAVAALIAAGYLAGALELFRYRQATASLSTAVHGLDAAPADLASWLGRLHPSLRNAVRQRVEGARVALPAPALTPYLVGLLVLLGMLGTLLGMMATLRGTGIALESATDLQAMRSSLAAPVKGLGFAFGTSIAGVATSAMLGLLAALCRRERAQAVQQLDGKIASTLRVYSPAHQREEAFKLLQQQTEWMPTLIERLNGMMATIEQQSATANERQLTQQEAFHSRTEAMHTRLAASVEASLKESVTESARAASATLQPVAEATMAGLARETAALRETVAQAVQQQLDQLTRGFDATTLAVGEQWSSAIAQQRDANHDQAQALREALAQFTTSFEQRSASMVEQVASRLDASTARTADAWQASIARQETAQQALAAHNEQVLTQSAAAFEQQASGLIAQLQQSQEQLHAALASGDQSRLQQWSDRFDQLSQALGAAWKEAGDHTTQRQQAICDTLAQTADSIATQAQAHARDTIAEIAQLAQAAAEAPRLAAEVVGELRQSHADQQAALEARDAQRLALWSDTFQTLTTALGQQWQQAGEDTARRQQAICDTLAQTADSIAAQAQAHARDTIAEIAQLAQAAAEAPRLAAEVVSELRQSHTDQQAALEARDEQRLALWSDTFQTLTTSLGQQWQQAGEDTARRQQAICDTLEQTAGSITAQAQAQASDTIAEISRLVQAASEAPKVAAEVVGELRQKLSDSMVRDTAMLEERSRLLATLETLLDAVNHASTEQRTAVDALVTTSADLLERVGTRFTDHIEAQTGKLDTAAAQLTGSAVEVASLGEAFGAAVQAFGQSNEALMERLEQIAGALDKSLTRSDEQLAYYVAQAREVVDLSVLSQKQIMDDLQQLALQRAAEAETA